MNVCEVPKMVKDTQELERGELKVNFAAINVNFLGRENCPLKFTGDPFETAHLHLCSA